MMELSEVMDTAWVEGLCLNDLWYWHELHVHHRSERLREQLHLLVAAAAVTVDGGEAFETLDQSLAPKAVAPPAAAKGSEKVQAERMTPNAVAYADEAAAVAAMMWRD